MRNNDVLELLTELVALVARPDATPARVRRALQAAGITDSARRVHPLSRGRVGAWFIVEPPGALTLAQLEAIHGPGRRSRDLHGDGPPSVTWDLDCGGGQHVVLEAGLGEGAEQPASASQAVAEVSVTPYYLDPE